MFSNSLPVRGVLYSNPGKSKKESARSGVYIPNKIWGIKNDINPILRLCTYCFLSASTKKYFWNYRRGHIYFVLLKGLKPEGIPSSYKLCAHWIIWLKIFERILVQRLNHTWLKVDLWTSNMAFTRTSQQMTRSQKLHSGCMQPENKTEPPCTSMTRTLSPQYADSATFEEIRRWHSGTGRSSLTRFRMVL